MKHEYWSFINFTIFRSNKQTTYRAGKSFNILMYEYLNTGYHFPVYLIVVLKTRFVGKSKKDFLRRFIGVISINRNKYKSETQPKQHLNDPNERPLKRDGKMNLIKIRKQMLLIGKTFDISSFTK